MEIEAIQYKIEAVQDAHSEMLASCTDSALNTKFLHLQRCSLHSLLREGISSSNILDNIAARTKTRRRKTLVIGIYPIREPHLS